jgi:hypothetical protein
MLPQTTSTFAPPESNCHMILRRYWTTACQACALKGQCTTGKERRISRWDCPDGPRYKVLGLADNSHRI